MKSYEFHKWSEKNQGNPKPKHKFIHFPGLVDSFINPVPEGRSSGSLLAKSPDSRDLLFGAKGKPG